LPMFTVLRRFTILLTMIFEYLVLKWVHTSSWCWLGIFHGAVAYPMMQIFRFFRFVFFFSFSLSNIFFFPRILLCFIFAGK
jgi:hypothetical protein